MPAFLHAQCNQKLLHNLSRTCLSPLKLLYPHSVSLYLKYLKELPLKKEKKGLDLLRFCSNRNNYITPVCVTFVFATVCTVVLHI